MCLLYPGWRNGRPRLSTVRSAVVVIFFRCGGPRRTNGSILNFFPLLGRPRSPHGQQTGFSPDKLPPERVAFSEFYFQYLKEPVHSRLSNPNYFVSQARAKIDDFGFPKKQKHESSYSAIPKAKKFTFVSGGGSRVDPLGTTSLKVFWVYRNGAALDEVGY